MKYKLNTNFGISFGLKCENIERYISFVMFEVKH